MGWLNSNLIHNVLNVIIALAGAVLWLGCDFLPDGSAACAQSFIPPEWAVPIATLSAAIKLIINIQRDKLSGLVKAQPPVADNVVTLVQPVKAVAKGEKISVTATVDKKVA